MKLLTFQEAFDSILDNITTHNIIEYINICDSLNSILAEDIYTIKDLPSFDNSAMDGYAIRYEDMGKKVKVVNTILAGESIDYELKSGQTYKIMTGAMMPKNANSVVKKEDIVSIDGDFVELPKNIKLNENIRFKAEEQKIGNLLLKQSQMLKAEHIALLSSQGITKLKVYKGPKIAILSNGNELIEPWNSAKEHQIYNSNSSAIQLLLKEFGFDCDYITTSSDDLDSLSELIQNLKSSYDVILTSGGISVGDADYIKLALQKNNLKEIFHGVNIKPGKPFMFGKLDSSYIFALPGNPLSTYMNLFIFVIPALFKLSNSKELYINFVYAKLSKDIESKGNRYNFILGELKNGEFQPILDVGSSMVSALAKANAILITNRCIKQHSFVKILPFKATFSSEFYDFKEAKIEQNDD